MSDTPIWRGISAPNQVDAHARAGDLFNKATSGLNSVFKELGDRQVKDAESALKAQLLGAKKVEDVAALEDGIMSGQTKIPGLELLGSDNIALGLQNRAKELEAEEITKMNRQNMIDDRQFSIAARDKAFAKTIKNEQDAAALRQALPPGKFNLETFDKLSAERNVSPEVRNAIMNEQNLRTSFTSGRKAASANDRRAKAQAVGGNDQAALLAAYTDPNIGGFTQEEALDFVKKDFSGKRSQDSLVAELDNVAFTQDLGIIAVQELINTIPADALGNERGDAQDKLIKVRQIWSSKGPLKDAKGNLTPKGRLHKLGLKGIADSFSAAIDIDSGLPFFPGNMFDEGRGEDQPLDEVLSIIEEQEQQRRSTSK